MNLRKKSMFENMKDLDKSEFPGTRSWGHKQDTQGGGGSSLAWSGQEYVQEGTPVFPFPELSKAYHLSKAQ